MDKGMATHSSILSWRIPWTEEPGGLQSMESQRVRHDWVSNPVLCSKVFGGGQWEHVTIHWPASWTQAMGASSPLSYLWNMHSAHPPFPPWELCQGHRLERVGWCWDQLKSISDWSPLRPLCQLKILGGECGDLFILGHPRQVASVSTLCSATPCRLASLCLPSLKTKERAWRQQQRHQWFIEQGDLIQKVLES